MTAGQPDLALTDLSSAAEKIGLSSLPAQLSFQQLCQQAPLPCLVRWRENEYAVVYRITRRAVYLADPARKQRRYPVREFLGEWIGESGHDSPASDTQGEVLLLEPSPDFWSRSRPKPKRSRLGLWWARWADFRSRPRSWGLDLGHEGEEGG